MAITTIAIDPGNHTGVAIRYDDGTFDALMIFESPTRIFQLIQNKPTLLVVESFHTRGNISKYGLYTVELIGGIKAICWSVGVPVIEHEPYIRLPYVQSSRALLTKTRVTTRFSVHEMDALAHLLAYEERRHLNTRDNPNLAGRSSTVYARRKGTPSTSQTIRAKLTDN